MCFFALSACGQLMIAFSGNCLAVENRSCLLSLQLFLLYIWRCHTFFISLQLDFNRLNYTNMKNKVFLIFFAFVVGITTPSLANDYFLKRVSGKLYICDKTTTRLVNESVVTVKLKTGHTLCRDLTPIRSNKFGFADISVPKGVDIEQFKIDLEQRKEFEIVKFAEYGELCLTPNDSLLSRQWYLGQINMFKAWDFTTGNQNIKVAVLDTEVDRNHSDIGIGNDTYSNINANLGYNFIYNTQNVVSPDFHGTGVAGIIGAKTNNSRGIAGISGGMNCSGVTIIPYCVAESLLVDMSSVDDAIIAAVDNGAKVINMSFTSPSTNFPEIDIAINYAFNNDVSLVAATGNDSDNMIKYPASNPHVIAVGAVDGSSSYRCSFSNYGDGLDIVAPGVSIRSTDVGGYNLFEKTSFAAPQVTGTIALMLSVRPSLKPTEIRDILRSSCSKLGGYTYDSNGWNSETGYGLLDAYSTLLNTIYISGPDIPCGTSVYSVPCLPSGYTVSWSWDDPSSSPLQIQSNTPLSNQCTIINANKPFFLNKLVATIWKAGVVIKTLSKDFDSGKDFIGTYQQDGFTFPNFIYPGTSITPLHSGDKIYLQKKGTITLKSDSFRNATISHSVTNGNISNWTHNDDTITFSFRYLSPIINNAPEGENPRNNIDARLTVTGTFPNSCNTFQFIIIGMEPIEIALADRHITDTNKQFVYGL